MEQSKKKRNSNEKKNPIIVAPPQQTFNIPPPRIISKSAYQIEHERPTYQIQRAQKYQTKPTSEDDENQLHYLEIGDQIKKRQKSQTQRWTSEEYRKRRRNRSEQRNTVMQERLHVIEKFNEFDDLDEISDDKADLCVKTLPQNRLIKKMTI